ncbi:hypothetical protein [Prevotella sp. E2-28]|uniref:hypothetical protein n=1 Tax=Prevotella sp. E2-28 TaxID=2913620 RepID=UPI001EDBF0A0|nr:hypothetical protein [Prevotella sp. E2-28]UKK52693.1 hypothetical protein L6465_08755 [Prevotella sp. E2-28]
MKQRILDLLNDEVYDICDAFTAEEFAGAVISVLSGITEHSEKRPIVIGQVVTVQLGKYIFKVSNKHKGFVSCSDTENGCTGTSETMYFPYYYDSDDPDAGLKNLIEMMNEAFYACNE